MKPEQKILALDTSADACSAALCVDGVIHEKFVVQPRVHAKIILRQTEELLADAGITLNSIDAIAFARGPGSFTGLRIAAGVCQGLAFGADLPVVPVSSLAGFAQTAYRAYGIEKSLVCIDAKMGDVYWAGFVIGDDGLARQELGEMISVPDAVALPESSDWAGIGSGWREYQSVLHDIAGSKVSEIHEEANVHAQDILRLGAKLLREQGAEPAEQAMPVYLRNEVAWKKQ